MRHLAKIALCLVLFSGAVTQAASAQSAPQTLNFSAFSNSALLRRGVRVHGGIVELIGDAAKKTVIGSSTYWLVPAGSANPYLSFVLFRVDGRKLMEIAIVPRSDTYSRYGYGSNLQGSHLTIVRPYDEPGKKCCKYDKYFEYKLSPNGITLVRVHYEPELP